MKVEDKTHMPAAYKGHTPSELDQMIQNYKNISIEVLQQIYRNYYR